MPKQVGKIKNINHSAVVNQADWLIKKNACSYNFFKILAEVIYILHLIIFVCI